MGSSFDGSCAGRGISASKITTIGETKELLSETVDDLGMASKVVGELMIANGVVLCPPGTQELEGLGMGSYIAGKDWRLAYYALGLVIAGQGDRALKHVNLITDASIHKKALEAIAPHLKTSR